MQGTGLSAVHARIVTYRHDTIAATHNQNPVPFVWTATAKAILKKTARAKQTLETVTGAARVAVARVP